MKSAAVLLVLLGALMLCASCDGAIVACIVDDTCEITTDTNCESRKGKQFKNAECIKVNLKNHATIGLLKGEESVGASLGNLYVESGESQYRGLLDFGENVIGHLSRSIQFALLSFSPVSTSGEAVMTLHRTTARFGAGGLSNDRKTDGNIPGPAWIRKEELNGNIRNWNTPGGDHEDLAIGTASAKDDKSVELDKDYVAELFDGSGRYHGLLLKNKAIGSFELDTKVTLWLVSEQTGACCQGGKCEDDILEADCNMKGYFQGRGTDCSAGVVCAPDSFTCFSHEMDYPQAAIPRYTHNGASKYTMNAVVVDASVHPELPPVKTWGVQVDGVTNHVPPLIGVNGCAAVDTVEEIRRCAIQTIEVLHEVDDAPFDRECSETIKEYGQQAVFDFQLYGFSSAFTKKTNSAFETLVPGPPILLNQKQTIAAQITEDKYRTGVLLNQMPDALPTTIAKRFGALIRLSEDDPALGLPPFKQLVFQDLGLKGAELFYDPSAKVQYHAEMMTVNGDLCAFTTLDAGKHTLELYNLANRPLELQLEHKSGVVPMLVIANSGGFVGYYAEPVQSVRLEPYQTSTVVADFSAFRGESVQLKNIESKVLPVLPFDLVRIDVGEDAGFTAALPRRLPQTRINTNVEALSQVKAEVEHIKLDLPDRVMTAVLQQSGNPCDPVEIITADDCLKAVYGYPVVWQLFNKDVEELAFHSDLKARVASYATAELDGKSEVQKLVELPLGDEMRRYASDFKMQPGTALELLVPSQPVEKYSKEYISLPRIGKHLYEICTTHPQCNYDMQCDKGEDAISCPDCMTGPTGMCGNGRCEAGDGETCMTCPSDCGSPMMLCCGDAGVCDGMCKEDGMTCREDPTDTTTRCGDGVCEGLENSTNCVVDCPATSNPTDDPFGVNHTPIPPCRNPSQGVHCV